MATHSEPMDVEQITPASAVNSVELVVAARAGERRTLIRVLDEAGWDGVNQAMAMDMSCAGANLLHFIAEVLLSSHITTCCRLCHYSSLLLCR